MVAKRNAWILCNINLEHEIYQQISINKIIIKISKDQFTAKH